MSDAVAVCQPKICEPGGSGYFLPRPHENTWGEDMLPLRAILYLAILFWFFMGVAIVADVFMGAIEKVTSKKKSFFNKTTGQMKTVRVWNDTVANLTLMALGSSAPEILLNVIEIILGEFELGPLGPSTIVGSAAFNLLIICAVCVIAIPSTEERHIKDTNVYTITATFSVFAYIWLLLIVKFITPEVVDIWEAVVTLLLFPVLVVLAYMADVGYFSGGIMLGGSRVDLESLTKEEYSHYEMKILQKYGSAMSDEEIANLMQKEYGQKTTRAAYRVHATRKLAGARAVIHVAGHTSNTSQVTPYTPVAEEKPGKTATIQFASGNYTVMESVGELELIVLRTGCETGTIKVGYKTIDGTAQGGKDFESMEGTLVFAKGVDKQSIKIPIINDADIETDEHFKVALVSIQCDVGDVKADLGELYQAEIRIIDDDDPGVICFAQSVLRTSEDAEGKIKVVKVMVERRNGSRGEVSIKYRTEEDSAKPDTDYEDTSGELVFADGVAEMFFEVKIVPRGRYESEERFRLLLEEPKGCQLAENSDRDMNICTVIIESDEEARDRVDRVVKALQMNWDKNQLGHSNWKDQFHDAILVPRGGDDDDESRPEPGCWDYVMHILSVFWKVLFACIPPPDYCDGWLCFSISLVMIGLVTAFIGDLANLVGCCLGLPGEITAITIVAMGTSLPDTFASKAAAEGDEYADASIGNVTGSNSVNVFLGLGLPWTIAAVYHGARGGQFNVASGNLATSVGVFCSCACCAILILYIRRRIVGGELGGNGTVKWISFSVLVFLWFVYIIASSIVVINNKGPCD